MRFWLRMYGVGNGLLSVGRWGILTERPGSSALVELEEQSKEGGWAVSAASVVEFLGSRVVGSL